MLRLKKTALTGGLSCGKSSVCRILKELGAYIISADEIVHQLLSSDTNLGQEVIKLLGNKILVNHQISRSRIANVVFQNDKLLRALEELVHPVVYEEIEKDYQKQKESHHPSPLFIAEIPLLFESGGEKQFDKTITVAANPAICLKRFVQATGYREEEFERRMNRQFPLLEKAVRADYVIMNNSDMTILRAVVKELYRELIEV